MKVIRLRERRKRHGAAPAEFGERRFLSSFNLAHRLALQGNNQWLPPYLVVEKLQQEFAFLESNDYAGIRYVECLIRHLERLQKRQYWSEREEQVNLLSERASQALYIRYGDDPASAVGFLDAVLLPSTPIVFRYLSEAHAEGAYPLVERSAKILEYSISELRGVDLAF